MGPNLPGLVWRAVSKGVVRVVLPAENLSRSMKKKKGGGVTYNADGLRAPLSEEGGEHWIMEPCKQKLLEFKKRKKKTLPLSPRHQEWS